MTPNAFVGILAFILALIASALVGRDPTLRARRWARWFFEPGKLTDATDIAHRAEKYMRFRDLWFVAVGLPMILLMLPVLALSILSLSPIPLMAYALTFGVRRAFAHISLEGPSFPQVFPIMIAKKVGFYCEEQQARETLDLMVASGDLKWAIAACHGYAQLSPELALSRLQKLSENKNPYLKEQAIRMISKVQEAMLGNRKVRHSSLVSHLKELKDLKLRLATSILRRRTLRRNLQLTFDQVENVMEANWIFRKSFPNLLCENCLARPQQFQHGQWPWVGCRKCKEASHLKLGVKAVLGQVGGDEDLALHNDVLTISLWDATKKQARAADLDRMEIIGGKDINYDWAVNAVLETFRNGGASLPENFQPVLIGSPPLGTNTIAHLKALEQH